MECKYTLINEIFNHNNELLICWTGKLMPAFKKGAKSPWLKLKNLEA